MLGIKQNANLGTVYYLLHVEMDIANEKEGISKIISFQIILLIQCIHACKLLTFNYIMNMYECIV